MAKFEIGKEYWARFWSKHDLLVGCKVLKKTEKTILVEFSDGEQKRFKLSAIPDFGEMFSPNKFYTFFAKNEGNWIRQRQKDYYGE